MDPKASVLPTTPQRLTKLKVNSTPSTYGALEIVAYNNNTTVT